MPNFPTGFTAQVEHEQRDIDRIAVVLQGVTRWCTGRPADLTLLGDRLDMVVRDCQRALTSVRASPVPSWELLADVRSRLTWLKSEALVLIQAVLVRAAGLDDGAGAVAEALIGDLAERARVEPFLLTAYADTESFDRDLRVVRLRFPAPTVWDLPVLAHEFGHHVAGALRHSDARLRDINPVAAWLQETADQESHPHAQEWAGELFADVFGLYALGKAYLRCVLLLRAVPDRFEGDPASTHPSWSRRIHTMSAAWQAIGVETGDSAVAMNERKSWADEVTSRWQAAGGAAPTGARRAWAESQANDIVRILGHHAPDRLRYQADGSLATLANWLNDAPEITADGRAAHSGEVLDVINAAWHWRDRGDPTRNEDLERMNRRAMAAVRRRHAD